MRYFEPKNKNKEGTGKYGVPVFQTSHENENQCSRFVIKGGEEGDFFFFRTFSVYESSCDEKRLERQMVAETVKGM